MRTIPRLYVFLDEGKGFREGRVAVFAAPELLALLKPASWGEILGVSERWVAGRWESVVYSIPCGVPQLLGEPLPLGKWPGRVVYVGDVDGDGITDLLVLERDGLRLVRGLERRGFDPLGTLIFQGSAQGASVGDLDADGLLDVVLALPQGSAILLQQKGRFVEGGFVAQGLNPRRVHLADLTGDGILDLVVERGSMLHLLPGNGRGGFLPVTSEFLLPKEYVVETFVPGNKGAHVVIKSTTFAHTKVLWNGGKPKGQSSIPLRGALLVGVGDLNGDGASDLFVQDVTKLDVLWNNGRGAFVRAPFADLAPFLPLAAVVTDEQLWVLAATKQNLWGLIALDRAGRVRQRVPIGFEASFVLVPTDLNANGTAELLGLVGGRLWVLWDERELRVYSAPEDLSVVAVGDVFGSGQCTVVVAASGKVGRLLGLRFADRELAEALELVRVQGLPIGLVVEDLDEDGAAEVSLVSLTFAAEGDPWTGSLQLKVDRVYLTVWSHPDRVHTLDLTADLHTPSGQDLPFPLRGLVGGDFTGDGRVDLALSTAGGTLVLLVPNAGEGRLGPVLSLPVACGPLFGADLDGNGLHEILGSTLDFDPAIWILWNGGGLW
ncbi:MAG: VCBS repeat-containing protein [Candidatus Bipolaricaulaceae bacterium]